VGVCLGGWGWIWVTGGGPPNQGAWPNSGLHCRDVGRELNACWWVGVCSLAIDRCTYRVVGGI